MLAVIKGPVKSCGRWTMLAQTEQADSHLHADLQGLHHRQLLVVSVVKLPAHTACGTALSREDSKIW